MIGQNKLLDNINNYSFFSFPQASILVGDRGCGKHSLVTYISTKYNTETIDISEQLTIDTISDVYVSSTPAIYVIDMSKIKRLDKSQNVILKLLEEPPINCKIILITEILDIILPTVQNRCHIFKFEPYYIEELRGFTEENNIEIVSEDLYSIYNTPGKLLEMTMDVQTYTELLEISDKIISSITKASIPNTLSLSQKFDFSNHTVDVFMHIMRLNILNYMTNKNIKFDMFSRLKYYYVETCNVCNKLKTYNINKQLLFENYLLTLKGVI